MKVVRLKHRTVLLAGSGEPTQPNNVPEYDDWLQ